MFTSIFRFRSPRNPIMAMPDPNRSQVEGSGMVANGVPLYVAPLAECYVGLCLRRSRPVCPAVHAGIS